MAKAIDLTNQHFGHLTVLERDYEIQKQHPNERQAWWKCYCDACGSIKSLRASIIKKAQTCGCKQNNDKKSKKPVQKKPKTKNNFRGIDLTGERFSRLLVLEYADQEHQVFYNDKHKNTWKCQCDCGNICYVTTENLKRGDTPSCGCITKENRRKSLKDLSGQKFGHLTVLNFIGTINGNSKYMVQCDCGKIYEIYTNNLTQGCTTSCGCTKQSHGQQKIREILTSNHINFISQKIFKDFKFKDTNGTPKFDFYLPDKNIIIEYDGQQHFRPIFNFDTQQSFQIRQKHDKEKNQYCFQNNITLIRIPYIHYNNLCLKDLLENSLYILKGEENARQYWNQTARLCSSH